MCNQRSNYGMCAKCTRLRELTKHHILCRRTWGSPGNTPLLHVCRSCHDIVDKLTEEWEGESREYIIAETAKWLKEV
jgi:hypothetical protein